MVECLNPFPFDKEPDNKNTIDINLKYLYCYAYTDALLNPQSPYESFAIDIVEELKQVNRNAFKNGFEFHNRIIQTNLRMIDQRTRYHGPCTDSLNYFFPVAFTITNTSDSEYTVKIISEPFLHMYNYFTSIHSYFTLKVMLPTLTSLHIDYFENENPENTLSLWENKQTSKFRIPAALLEYTLRSALYDFNPDLYRSSCPVEFTLNYADQILTFSTPW